MEYCGSIWDPSTKELTQKLESVQNRGARFVTGNYKCGSSVTEMKKGAGVGIIGREKESEQGLHFTSSPIGSPCHTNANDSAPGPPLIKTQSIYSTSHK